MKGHGLDVAEDGRVGRKLTKTIRPLDPFGHTSRRSGFTLWSSLNARGSGFRYQVVVKMGIE